MPSFFIPKAFLLSDYFRKPLQTDKITYIETYLATPENNHEYPL